MIVETEKKIIRQKMLVQRSLLTLTETEEKSSKIAGMLCSLPHFSNASVLLIYLPIKNEPDTQSIIEKAWQQKKTVLIPVCLPDRTLLLSELLSFDDVEKGFFNILEPKPEALRPIPVNHVDIAILPGLAFDYHGHRLGYGGGYFDSLLPLLSPDSTKIALAYDFQLLDKIPVSEHDAPVDIIITEHKAHFVSK